LTPINPAKLSAGTGNKPMQKKKIKIRSCFYQQKTGRFGLRQKLVFKSGKTFE